VDLEALEILLVRFSQLIVEQCCIKEFDINPLIASSDGLLALDARVVVHGPEMTEADLPRIAIRPYPNQYVSPWTMKDGRKVIIRPIRAEDEPLVTQFHETISERSVTLRYLSPMALSQRVAHERLARICHNDYDREIALVVEGESKDGKRQIFAMARMSKLHGGENEARVTMMVSDPFQGQGIGAELLKRFIQIARDEGIERLLATMSPENPAMRKLCERNGFSLRTDSETGMVEAELHLK
jgi:acetyltransferase